jgi:sulfite exporter TauE/SafE
MPVKILSAVPFVLGFLTGINPCPPFITGFVRLLEIASILKGIFYFTGFFVSTSLFILPAILPTPWINARLKNIGRIALFLSSLWYLFMSIGSL